MPSRPIPELLSAIRQRTGQTQEALARRLGVSFPTVNTWERGHRQPKPEHMRTIQALAVEVGIRPDLCVLVIDDDPADCTLMELLIAASPTRAQVTTETNATKGLLLYGDLKPDVVFLDIMMPGLDGVELAQRAREIDGLGNVHIAFITGLRDEEVLERARNVDQTTLIRKPATQDDVDRLLADAAGSSGSDDEVQVVDDPAT